VHDVQTRYLSTVINAASPNGIGARSGVVNTRRVCGDFAGLFQLRPYAVAMSTMVESDFLPVVKWFSAEVKSGNVTNAKSLGVFQSRYNPRSAVILSARNLGRQGSRMYIPLYAAGWVKDLVTWAQCHKKHFHAGQRLYFFNASAAVISFG
jgi:hypothetical protein